MPLRYSHSSSWLYGLHRSPVGFVTTVKVSFELANGTETVHAAGGPADAFFSRAPAEQSSLGRERGMEGSRHDIGIYNNIKKQ